MIEGVVCLEREKSGAFRCHRQIGGRNPGLPGGVGVFGSSMAAILLPSGPNARGTWGMSVE